MAVRVYVTSQGIYRSPELGHKLRVGVQVTVHITRWKTLRHSHVQNLEDDARHFFTLPRDALLSPFTLHGCPFSLWIALPLHRAHCYLCLF